MSSYMCRDCGERVDEPSFTGDKYNCPYCGVYDEETGEVQDPPKPLNTNTIFVNLTRKKQ